jgi:hypothetical protein
MIPAVQPLLLALIALVKFVLLLLLDECEEQQLAEEAFVNNREARIIFSNDDIKISMI